MTSGSALTGAVLSSVAGFSSRTPSASWIAESAASVGSILFFGLFAISVVASFVTRYQDNGRRPRHECVIAIPAADFPRPGSGLVLDKVRPADILSAWRTNGNCLG